MSRQVEGKKGLREENRLVNQEEGLGCDGGGGGGGGGVYFRSSTLTHD